MIMTFEPAVRAVFTVMIKRYCLISHSVYWVTCSDKSCITNCIVDAIHCISNDKNDGLTIINAT